MTTTPQTLPDMPRLASLFRLQYEEAQKAWVLLYPEGVVQLNDSAAAILRQCDGSRDIATIVHELQSQFAVQGIHTEVVNLLQEGQRRGWIV